MITITYNQAWAIAKYDSKPPPYPGYILRLGCGKILVCAPTREYLLFDTETEWQEWAKQKGGVK